MSGRRDRKPGLPLMAGNWKMNGNHLEAIALVQKLAFTLSDKDFDVVDVAVLPPFTSLRSVQTLVEGDRLRIAYGAQDVSQHPAGAYTGDISASMLTKLGCDYVLAGHSERRQYHHEDDALRQRQGEGRTGSRDHAHHVRGRGPGDPSAGAAGGTLRQPGDRITCRHPRGAGGRHGDRL